MFKRIVAWTIMLLMMANPVMVSAGELSLSSAFSNLLGGANASVNSPGYYQSGARNAFVGGGVELRVPSTSFNAPQLITISPPRVEAGCNGISMHFGGFSFISGEEFEALLKAIASGMAMGFVSMLALKVACAQCEAIVQFLKTMAARAAELARNACQIGQKMGQELAKGLSLSTSGSSKTEVCGVSTAADGMVLDMLKGMNSLCKSTADALNSLQGTDEKYCRDNGLSSDDCKQYLTDMACKRGVGNVTWSRLSAFDGALFTGATLTSMTDVQKNAYRRKLLMMNMMGVELAATPGKDANGNPVTQPSCETSQGTISVVASSREGAESKPIYCPRTVERGEHLTALFMCGSPNSSGKYSDVPAIQGYCSSFAPPTGTPGATENAQLYVCVDDPVNCNQLERREFSQALPGTGFLPQINNILRSAVTAVSNNQPMPPEAIQLMQVAPYPLYQAINSAAVYPASAGALIDSMSVLIAEQAAVSFMNVMIRNSGGNKAFTCLSPEQAKGIYDIIGTIRSYNASRMALIGQSLNTQRMLSEQIRQINTTIQQEVLSAEQLSNTSVAVELNKALMTGSPVGGAGGGTGGSVPSRPAGGRE